MPAITGIRLCDDTFSSYDEVLEPCVSDTVLELPPVPLLLTGNRDRCTLSPAAGSIFRSDTWADVKHALGIAVAFIEAEPVDFTVRRCGIRDGGSGRWLAETVIAPPPLPDLIEYSVCPNGLRSLIVKVSVLDTAADPDMVDTVGKGTEEIGG